MQIASTPQVPSLTDVIARCMTNEALRRTFATDPLALLAAQGCDCSQATETEELSALFNLKAPLLDFSDERLGKAVRRTRREPRQGDAEAVEMLLDFRSQVMASARSVLASLRPPAPIHALLSCALEETATLAQVAPCLPALDFPAAVYASCTGRVEPAVPASVASLFYYMGISLFDDIIDKDLIEPWASIPEGQVAFTSLALCAGLPGQALEALGAKLEPGFAHRAAAWFQRAAYEVNIGQFLDVSASLEGGTTVVDCEQIVELKTGSTGALTARLGADLAGLGEGERERWAQIGSSIYSAMQVASDIHDVWGKPLSPDLANCILTLPIVYACRTLEGKEQARLQHLLCSRTTDPSHHQEMRSLISSSGALRYSLLRAEVYRQRAIAALSRLDLEPNGALLMAYVTNAAQMGDLSP